MISLERSYEGRITAVYKEGGLVTGAQSGKISTFKYSAAAVDTHDRGELVNVTPFRRWIFGSGPDEPEINAAQVGDHCRIAVCGGEWRLVVLTEQYLCGGCETPPNL